jgi:hypothetical protein
MAKNKEYPGRDNDQTSRPKFLVSKIEELKDVLTGKSSGGTVVRTYPCPEEVRPLHIIMMKKAESICHELNGLQTRMDEMSNELAGIRSEFWARTHVALGIFDKHLRINDKTWEIEEIEKTDDKKTDDDDDD